ncbi:MAG: peptide deformylase [Clostridia bacterium]|nr:peptide deformylase [Clostridia bacterium]
MVKPIVRDALFLMQKSRPAVKADLSDARDLLDTLEAHRHECVGMAANMIGVSKRIIAVNEDGRLVAMFNPELLSCEGEYKAEEGCLSIPGKRETTRYKTIKVKYRDERFKMQIKSFTGFTAQIIQHEMDHLEGILI